MTDFSIPPRLDPMARVSDTGNQSAQLWKRWQQPTKIKPRPAAASREQTPVDDETQHELDEQA